MAVHKSLISSAYVPSSLVNPERLRRQNLACTLKCTLDRVNVLGDSMSGHTGCVNALSWARDGGLLISGGDDTTVRIWALDPADVTQEYPFVSQSVIQTGHRANIFSAQMLPCSSRLATAAGDQQVRVFDIGETQVSYAPDGRDIVYSTRQSCIRILRCHKDRVKRIVTEHSPDLFLSVAEDGTVRQHDLRAPHDCRDGACGTPLVKVDHELSTLALSPLTPYQLVVAGESPYGYLYDRRHTGRVLQAEWGVPQNSSELTTCVRRFGRPKNAKPNGPGLSSDHITGARMSAQNGNEVLLSYSGDAVYLFSTLDDPGDEHSPSSILPTNNDAKETQTTDPTVSTQDGDPYTDSMDVDIDNLATSADNSGDSDHPTAHPERDEGNMSSDDGDENEAVFEFSTLSESAAESYHPDVPVVLPRRRFAGARNVATVKDVNFLGPNDEYVTSGSDDGNFFIWRKSDGLLRGIYEGDGSVVNMVEGHPTLPLIAVSGIDATVKLFAPTKTDSQFSKMGDAKRIMEKNERYSRVHPIRYSFATLLAQARLAMGDSEAECRNQ